MIAVDSNGWVHVLFYDNRPAFVDDPACNEPGYTGKYDIYYALSTDYGQTFTVRNLRLNCDQEPALDLDLQGSGVPAGFSPHEYNGLAIYESGGSTRVWTLYTGTSDHPEDDPLHRSVIFGQQIVVGPAQ